MRKSVVLFGVGVCFFVAMNVLGAELVNGQQSAMSGVARMKSIAKPAGNYEGPKIISPDWYVAKEKELQKKATEQQRTTSATKTTYTYAIATKGSTRSNLTEFRRQVAETLNDGRGWTQTGAIFKEVNDQPLFTIILSEARLLPSFSSGCSVDWSCRVGANVIINDNRWSGATTAWNNAGGDLRNYRHMVINHEVGHWLGHGHESCGGAGQLAPVMQQQSISLQGCTFNPWPLKSELWKKR